ncbi:AmmeMemoRadiSam system protein A [Aurantivibrio plasticivorans]
MRDSIVNRSFELSIDDQKKLLRLARTTIESGARTSTAIPVNVNDYPASLAVLASSFVTLHKNDQLRGCIGSLSPTQALVSDVAEHAYAAAFRDPRFPAVTEDEVPALHIEISVLTPQQPIDCSSEEDLLNQLNANQDGLTIEDGHYRATFLPSVWGQLPDKREFLTQLKRKAGLSSNHWSHHFKAYRYHTLSFAED